MYRSLTVIVVLLAPAPLAAQGLRGNRENIWKVYLKKYDADKDGRIDEKEYTRGKAKFRQLDSNDDGVLTAADFRARRRPAVGRPAQANLPGPGEVAPDFELAYAKDKSKTVRLSSFAGKRPVVLIFGSYT